MKTYHLFRYMFVAAPTGFFLSGLCPMPAQAGFEWIPPVKHEEVKLQAAAMPAPSVSVSVPDVVIQEAAPLDILDIPVTQDSAMFTPLPEPVPLSPPMDVADGGLIINPDPLNRPMTSNTIQPQTALPTVQGGHKSAPFPHVQGFGEDVPLAVALRQVVPAEYAFIFGPDVNAGVRVSWEGNRPWDQVVLEMIRPFQMQMSVTGRVVRIDRIGNPSAAGHSAITPTPSAESPQQQAAVKHSPIDLRQDPLRRIAVRDPGEKAGG